MAKRVNVNDTKKYTVSNAIVSGFRFTLNLEANPDYSPLFGGALGLHNDGYKRFDLSEVRVELRLIGRSKRGKITLYNDTLQNIILSSEYDSSVYDAARYGNRWEPITEDGKEVVVPLSFDLPVPICLKGKEVLEMIVKVGSDFITGSVPTYSSIIIDGNTQTYIESQDGVPFLNRKECYIDFEHIDGHIYSKEPATFSHEVHWVEAGQKDASFDLGNNVTRIDIIDYSYEIPNLLYGELSPALNLFDSVSLTGSNRDETWSDFEMNNLRLKHNKNYVEAFVRKSHWVLHDDNQNDLDRTRIDLSFKDGVEANTICVLVKKYYTDERLIKNAMAKSNKVANHLAAKAKKAK